MVVVFGAWGPVCLNSSRNKVACAHEREITVGDPYLLDVRCAMGDGGSEMASGHLISLDTWEDSGRP